MRRDNYYLLAGVIISFGIIYLTKIDTTPAAAAWIYEMGQYLWFNLAISYLASLIFYCVVVYLPAQRKLKHYKFQKAMDLQALYYKSLGFFYNLKMASKIQTKNNDTGEITMEEIEQMITLVNPSTSYTFLREPGSPTQTFKTYIEILKGSLIESIGNSLTIPYEDENLTLILLQFRSSIIKNKWLSSSDTAFDKIDVLSLKMHSMILDSYWQKHFKKHVFEDVPNEIIKRNNRCKKKAKTESTK